MRCFEWLWCNPIGHFCEVVLWGKPITPPSSQVLCCVLCWRAVEVIPHLCAPSKLQCGVFPHQSHTPWCACVCRRSLACRVLHAPIGNCVSVGTLHRSLLSCVGHHSRSMSPRPHRCYVSLIPGDPLCHSYCTITASSNCTMVEQDLEVVLWRGCENSTMWQDWGLAHAPCAASLCLSVCKRHVDTLWITFVDSITQDIWLCSEL